MQNQLNGDLLNPEKSPFIFEGSGGDVIIDGILSDSNESSSSSGHHHHRHHHHQQQHPPQLQHHPHHGHLNHSLNVTTLNSPMNGQLHTLHTSTENSQKRKFDEYLESNGNSNETINEPKKVPHNGKKTKGRVKIKMEFIDNKLRRYTTFSKRKTGIMKKAYELSTLTGTQVMLLVASETGHVYTFATKKLQPMITSEAGKALIQTCLNSPDPPTNSGDQRMCATGFEETDLTYSISDDSEKEDASSSSSSSAQYAPAPKENPVSVAASASSNFETNSHINTQSSQPSNICTTAAYTTLQNALPTSLFQTASIDSSNLVASKSISSSATGTTFTTTILGGVGPTSGNIASSQIQASSFGTTSINRNTNQQTLYKFSDVGTSSAAAANRIGSKITSTPVLSAGSVVFCTNPSGSSSITSVPVMYQTPSGVVYATTNSAVFPDNLILNLGHNIENLGPNSASASREKILSSSCFVTPSSTSPQVTTKNGNSKGGSSKKVKK